VSVRAADAGRHPVRVMRVTSNHASVARPQVNPRWQRQLERWSEQLADNPFKRAWRAIAVATVLITLIGGLLVRLTDPDTFTRIGTGIWWSVQTVTTVGYGDVVPGSAAGRATAAVVMLAGLSLLSVTTAAVTNAFVQAASRRRGATRDDAVLAELTAVRAELAELRETMVAAAQPKPPTYE
jgi:voltage-gated potassium channel